MSDIALPPLFSALDVAGRGDPFALACVRAAVGCDAGLVLYHLSPERMRAALILAPEVGLSRAVAMLPLCGVGFQNALGALAPPEVSVHLDWDGGVRLNGARAGALRIAAAPCDASALPDAVPDWLVIGLTLDLWSAGDEGGHSPGTTALFAEGCTDVAPDVLLGAWIRHTLVWLNRWESEGNAPLHRAFRGLAHGIDDEIAVLGETGIFCGLDENLGLLLKQADTVRLIPLTALLTLPTETP